jgi:hypothetical protein
MCDIKGLEMSALDEFLSKSKKLREGATSGRWYSDTDGDVWTDAEKEFCPGIDQELFKVLGTTTSGPDPGDGKFIAHARNTDETKDQMIAIMAEALENAWCKDCENLCSNRQSYYCERCKEIDGVITQVEALARDVEGK